MHACIHTSIHTYIHTYMHTYIHTYMHAYIRTYMHARIIDTDKDTDDKTKINVYTDGSKWEQGVGAGIVITHPGNPTIKLMYRMGPKCTNNQAEAYAILKALEYLQNTQTNEDDKAVTVHSDSMTTLESLINADIHIPD